MSLNNANPSSVSANLYINMPNVSGSIIEYAFTKASSKFLFFSRLAISTIFLVFYTNVLSNIFTRW